MISDTQTGALWLGRTDSAISHSIWWHVFFRLLKPWMTSSLISAFIHFVVQNALTKRRSVNKKHTDCFQTPRVYNIKSIFVSRCDYARFVIIFKFQEMIISYLFFLFFSVSLLDAARVRLAFTKKTATQPTHSSGASGCCNASATQ